MVVPWIVDGLRQAATTGPDDLQIAALLPHSSTDWPGHAVATVLLQGCPWTCVYCRDPDLISSRTPGTLTWAAVASFLQERRTVLDGVVFGGGEPTRQIRLLEAVSRVRAMGFAVGLHTSGAYPTRLARVLDDVAWVGLDVKALPESYPGLVGPARSGVQAWKSLDLVLASGVEHEIRTTVMPGMAPGTFALAQELRFAGVRTYALQQAAAGGSLSTDAAHRPGWDAEFARLARDVGALGFERLEVRPAG